MKITQLDYSAIKSANSSLYNQKVAAIDQTQFMQDYDYNQTVKTYNRTMTAINAVTSTIDTIKSIYDYSNKKDTATANNSLETNGESFIADLKTLASKGGLSTHDSEGNFSFTEEYNSLVSSYRSKIESLEVSNGVKEQALQSWDKFVSENADSYRGQVADADLAALQQLAQNEINSAIVLDSQAGNGNSMENLEAVLAKPEYAGLFTPNQLKVIRTQATQEMWADRVYAAAQAAGSTGVEEVMNLPEFKAQNFSAQAIDTLKSTAAQMDARTTTQLKEDVSNTFSQLTSQYGVALARVRVTSMINNMGDIDPDRKQTLLDALDTAQLSYVMEQYPNISQIDKLNQTELSALYKSLFSGAEITENSSYMGVFAGMKEVGDAYKKTIKNAYDKAGATATSTYASTIEEAVANGTMAPALGLDMLYALNSEAGLAVPDAEGNMITLSSGVTVSTADEEAVWKSIENIRNSVVPKAYEDSTKEISDYLKTLFKDPTLADISEGMKADITSAAQADLLQLFMNTAGENITPEMVNKQIASIKDKYTAQALVAIQASGAGKLTLEEGASGDLKADKFIAAYDAMGQSHQVYLSTEVVNGQVQTVPHFINEESTRVQYETAARTGVYLLEKAGIKVDPTATDPYYKAPDGTVSSYPVYKDTDGNRYLIQEGNIYRLTGSGSIGETVTTVKEVVDHINEIKGTFEALPDDQKEQVTAMQEAYKAERTEKTNAAFTLNEDGTIDPENTDWDAVRDTLIINEGSKAAVLGAGTRAKEQYKAAEEDAEAALLGGMEENARAGTTALGDLITFKMTDPKTQVVDVENTDWNAIAEEYTEEELNKLLKGDSSLHPYSDTIKRYTNKARESAKNESWDTVITSYDKTLAYGKKLIDSGKSLAVVLLELRQARSKAGKSTEASKRYSELYKALTEYSKSRKKE